MRLIDADELIASHAETVSKHKLYENGMTLAWGEEVVSVKNIKDAPTVKQWIPCSERLPEKSGRYLVTNSDWGSYEVSWNIWLTNSGQWLYNGNPIAWMPLPEPYRGDD